MYENNLKELVENGSHSWIFVGGKGGVGKTTTSCSLGVQLAAVRKNVLIVSTDPAHNLSDAFNQKFGRIPTLVDGFDNLYCMEIDPNVELEDDPDLGGSSGGSDIASSLPKMFKSVANNIPGIDELLSFAELMKHVQRMDFDVTVFDTAPTGHTLRLLSLPDLLDKALTKVLSFRSTIGPMLNSVQALSGGASGLPTEEALMGHIEEFKSVIDAVQSRIHSADETTFVCVCIPEFLSLYETERLVQELSKFDIDTHNIVVNQVLFADDDKCKRCAARIRMQTKYLDQINDLYEDFNVVKTPLLYEEVRGSEKLAAFGKYLLKQYEGEEIPAVLKGSHD